METLPSKETEAHSDLLTSDMFENLNLPPEIPLYEGTGPTSFKREHDLDKLEYMKSLGLEESEDYGIANGEIIDRPRFGSTYIVFTDILILHELKQKGENIDQIIPYINQKLRDKRIANHGERLIIGNGSKRLSEIYGDKGFSGNPTLKVTEEELQNIINRIFEDIRE